MPLPPRWSLFIPRPLLVLAAGLLLWGCGSDDARDPSIEDQTVNLDDRQISVAGTVAVFPEAARLLEARGIGPVRLEGLPLTLEEPLRVAVSDPDATFATGVSAADGRFSISGVHVLRINTTLAAGVVQPGFARTSTVLFDTAVSGGRPHLDLVDTRAYVLPLAFEEQLDRALGPERLKQLTSDRAQTLAGAGYVLGRVVDAAGNPVAGAEVEPDRADYAWRLHYPSTDLETMGRIRTSSNGLFLFVHSGDEVETFRFLVKGQKNEFPPNAGAVAGLGLVITLTVP